MKLLPSLATSLPIAMRFWENYCGDFSRGLCAAARAHASRQTRVILMDTNDDVLNQPIDRTAENDDPIRRPARDVPRREAIFQRNDQRIANGSRGLREG
jgi:hypothetical protein